MTAKKNEVGTVSRYEGARDGMRTGDLVAFGGKGRISGLIKLITRSLVSHVGLVLRADFSLGKEESVMLIESTTLTNLPDMATGHLIKGVQMHWLSTRLSAHEGEAWWHPLKTPLAAGRAEEMTRWLRKAHAQQLPYDTIQAIGAGVDFWDGLGLTNDPDFSRLFCSELCARALQIAGRLPQDLNPSEETPASLLARDIFQAGVELR
jgi:hypothetical protein